MAGVENDNNNNESEDDFGNQNLEDKNAYKTIDLDDEMKRIIALRVGLKSLNTNNMISNFFLL